MSTPDGRTCSTPETAGQAPWQVARDAFWEAERGGVARTGDGWDWATVQDGRRGWEAAVRAIAAAAPAAPIVLRMDAPPREVPYEATLIPERVDVAAAPAPAAEARDGLRGRLEALLESWSSLPEPGDQVSACAAAVRHALEDHLTPAASRGREGRLAAALAHLAADGQWLTVTDDGRLDIRDELLARKRYARDALAGNIAPQPQAAPSFVVCNHSPAELGVTVSGEPQPPLGTAWRLLNETRTQLEHARAETATIRAAAANTARDLAEVTEQLAALQDAAPKCPNGCGCRLGTEDAEVRDCACDGLCCYDEIEVSELFAERAKLAALLDHETRLTWDSGLPGERQRVTVVREQAGLEALT